MLRFSLKLAQAMSMSLLALCIFVVIAYLQSHIYYAALTTSRLYASESTSTSFF